MPVTEKQVYIRKGAKVPDQLRLGGRALDADWLALPVSTSDLENRVQEADWHFFRLDEEVVGMGIGISQRAAAEAALRRCLRRIRSTRNVAEVLAIHHRRLLGLDWCEVRVAVRHIQFGPILNLTPSVGLVSPALAPASSPGLGMLSASRLSHQDTQGASRSFERWIRKQSLRSA